MNINGTLFAQIANFLIAYVIMNKLLFRSVIDEIARDKDEIAVLEEKRDQEKEKYVNLAKKKEAIWQEFRKRFAVYVSKLFVISKKYSSLSMGIRTQDPVIAQQEVNHLARLIVHEVDHVRK